MADDFAIKVENVSKTFKLPHEKSSSIKSHIVNFWRRKKGYEIQEALKDVSFEVQKGEFFGIVGRNGSGKSTLLKMLAGIYAPTEGNIKVNGKLTPFIELGVGFNPELTGRENVFLNGALLGFNRSEMEAMYDDIVAFAELERFMDQKLKNYSSGMQVRLAFAIAVKVDSDMYLFDEVLAVGDERFQKKCLEVFRKLKAAGKTIILVSHNTTDIERFCDKVLVLDKSVQVGIYNAQDGIGMYHELNQEQVKEGSVASQPSNRWGSGRVRIEDASVVGARKTLPGDEVSIRIRLARDDLKNKLPVNVGLAFYDEEGVNLSGPNSYADNLEFDNGERELVVEYKSKLPFNSGVYNITVAAISKDKIDTYDHRTGVTKLNIRNGRNAVYGKVLLDGQWQKIS